MKCPYVTTTIYADKPLDPRFYESLDGEQIYQFPIFQTQTEVMHDCIMEECAAWQNNQCNYNR